MITAEKSRVDWIDYAKGITIMLVVFHHAVGVNQVYQNEVVEFLHNVNYHLIFLRMPLFMLIAGLFIRKALESPWQTFLNGKIIHLLYLYLLWSFIKDMLVETSFGLVGSETSSLLTNLNPAHLLEIFVSPPETLWFIYALLLFFVATRVLRNLPPLALLFGAGVLYTICTTGQHFSLPFYQRLGQLFFFFVLGYSGSPYILKLGKNTSPYLLFLTPLYVVIAAWLLQTQSSFDALILMAQLTGITVGITAAHTIAKLRVFGFIKYVGSLSLAIYLGHFFPLLILDKLAQTGMLTNDLLHVVLGAVLGVTLSIILYRLAFRFGFMWLFRAPSWLRVTYKPRIMPTHNSQG